MTNVAYTFFGATFPVIASSLNPPVITKTKIDTIGDKSSGDKLITPVTFGYLMAAFTAIPNALAVPFFLFAGYKMVQIKKARDADKS